MSETDDYIAIRRLQNAYADVVTRRAWDELTDLFRSDAPIEIDTRRGEDGVFRFVGPQALGEFISGAMVQFDFFEFVILNTRIELAVGGDADAADGRMYMSEIRTDADTGTWNISFGVYHDGYRRADGRWRFARRRYHSLGRTGETRDIDAFPFPHELRLGDL
jgi:SnoaL-like domain